jgi:hypothetical protein
MVKQKAFDMLLLSMAFSFLFILCGASPYDHLFHTCVAALYCVALIWFDPSIFVEDGTMHSLRTCSLVDSIVRQLRGQYTLANAAASTPQIHQQFVVSQTIVYACSICTTLFQVLLLYDRGYQMQRWPIPIVAGCTFGWILGILVGTARAIYWFR